MRLPCLSTETGPWRQSFLQSFLQAAVDVCPVDVVAPLLQSCLISKQLFQILRQVAIKKKTAIDERMRSHVLPCNSVRRCSSSRTVSGGPASRADLSGSRRIRRPSKDFDLVIMTYRPSQKLCASMLGGSFKSAMVAAKDSPCTPYTIRQEAAVKGSCVR